MLQAAALPLRTCVLIAALPGLNRIIYMCCTTLYRGLQNNKMEGTLPKSWSSLTYLQFM